MGHDRSDQPGDLIEAAVRSKIVIDALDTGGVTELPGARAANGMNPAAGDREPGNSNATLPLVLVDLARGTAGTYVTGNDYGVNFRKLSTPESYYVLSFVPTAKADGKLHQLKVKLEKKGKFTIDARNGYYAGGAAE